MGNPRGKTLASALLFGGVALAACRTAPQVEVERVEHVDLVQERVLASSDLFGTTLPNKTLALTFDDGPGDRTSELSSYLAAQGIRATFFVNGARIAPTGLSGGPGQTANAAAHLAQIVADGHLVANHTTTHRSLTGANGPLIPTGERVQELTETDSDIAAYNTTGHWLFRAPFGDWSAAVATTLNASAMTKYVGPVRWEIGGDANNYPTRAADWACWQGQLNGSQFATTTQCGNAYLNEIAAVTGQKGIVLMHDPYFYAGGNTVDMVKYIVPILKGNGYSFVRVDEVPAIAALMPCNAPCATCSAFDSNVCATCSAGSYKSGGTCKTCTTCAAGTYQATACTANADTVCTACHASCATCTGGASNQCTTCNAGSYRSAGSCLPCTVCAAGTFESAACTATTNTVCTACDATCATCTGASANACGTCNAGRYLSGTSCNACAVCAANQYTASACTTTSNTTCAACNASCAACTGPGPGDCANCPSGSFLSAGVCKTCKTCPPGAHRVSSCTASTDAVCEPCAAGSYSTAANVDGCMKCAAGTIAAAPGATECTPCPPGTSAAAGTASCVACPSGTYAATARAGACASCGSCDDGNACTVDACDPVAGCVHTKVAGCGGGGGADAGPAPRNGGPIDDDEKNPVSPSDDGGCAVVRPGRSRESGGLPSVVAVAFAFAVARRRRRA